MSGQKENSRQVPWKKRLEMIKQSRPAPPKSAIRRGPDTPVTPNVGYLNPKRPALIPIPGPKISVSREALRPRVAKTPAPKAVPRSSVVHAPKVVPEPSPKVVPEPTPTPSPPSEPKVQNPSPVKSVPSNTEKVGITVNTHDYDGKLRQEIQEAAQMLPIEKDSFGKDMITLKTLIEAHHKLEGSRMSPASSKFFDDIVNDHFINPSKNFDPTNGVDAAQVLYNIHLKVKTLLELTSLQLEDMATGPCPQGRATRLLSVFLST